MQVSSLGRAKAIGSINGGKSKSASLSPDIQTQAQTISGHSLIGCWPDVRIYTPSRITGQAALRAVTPFATLSSWPDPFWTTSNLQKWSIFETARPPQG